MTCIVRALYRQYLLLFNRTASLDSCTRIAIIEPAPTLPIAQPAAKLATKIVAAEPAAAKLLAPHRQVILKKPAAAKPSAQPTAEPKSLTPV